MNVLNNQMLILDQMSMVDIVGQTLRMADFQETWEPRSMSVVLAVYAWWSPAISKKKEEENIRELLTPEKTKKGALRQGILEKKKKKKNTFCIVFRLKASHSVSHFSWAFYLNICSILRIFNLISNL